MESARKRQQPAASEEEPDASTLAEMKRITCTELLNLDDAILTTIAAKCNRWLRSTCKRLRDICDSSRSSLRIVSPCTAGRQLLSLTRWPNIQDMRIFQPEHAHACPDSSGDCRKFFAVSLVAAMVGRHLVKLVLAGLQEDIHGPLLGQLLKGCQGTLRELTLTGFNIAEDVKCVADEVKGCKLELFTLVHMKPIPLLSEWLDPATSSNLRTVDVEMTGIESIEQLGKFGRCLGTVEDLCFRSCPTGLNFNELFRECHALLCFDVAMSLEAAADAVVIAAAFCPRLQDVVIRSPLSATALRALAANCKGLKHLGVTLNVVPDDAGALLEAFKEMSNLQSLQLQICDEVEPPSEVLLQDALVSGIYQLKRLQLLRLGYLEDDDNWSPLLSSTVAHINAVVWHLPRFEALAFAKQDDMSNNCVLQAANIVLQPRGIEAYVEVEDSYSVELKTRKVERQCPPLQE